MAGYPTIRLPVMPTLVFNIFCIIPSVAYWKGPRMKIINEETSEVMILTLIETIILEPVEPDPVCPKCQGLGHYKGLKCFCAWE